MGGAIILACIVLWGTSTFLNRLSVETSSPILLQVIVGLGYVIYLPIALKLSGIDNPFQYRWSMHSVLLTLGATTCSIVANVLLYGFLKGNNHTGANTMLISMYPIVTLLLSVAFLHERFSLIKVAGILTMIGGAFLLSY
jgi:drug/metabolite transporter (DMT)-like permease